MDRVARVGARSSSGGRGEHSKEARQEAGPLVAS